MLGITGTKGKTTTAYFTYQLLENNQRKSALTSTTFFARGNKLERNLSKMGMPGRFFLPDFLRKCINENIKFAVIETTSEGILQHRQRFLSFNTAVFTGLSPEHIERHGSFAAYREAKEKLFTQCQETHVLNLNDKYAKHFLRYPAKQKWGIILNKKISRDFLMETRCQFLLEGITSAPNNLKIKEWRVTNGKKKLVSENNVILLFPGKFNALNLLLALASARSTGLTSENLIAAVPQLVLPPGRMQEITDTDIPYRIFLDYAHEPLSLKSALQSCKNLLPDNKKLVCLIGAQGGGRDKWKRKVMGRIAANLCDYVIVGTEDPYLENPGEINKEVLRGVLSNNNFTEDKNCWKLTDRRKAIKKALSLAQPEDIVILCGKGGEKIMCLGDKKIPWDEEEEVKKITKKSQNLNTK